MKRGFALLVIGCSTLLVSVASAATDPKTAVRDALSRGRFPWYNARNDSLESVLTSDSEWQLLDWIKRWFGWLRPIARLFDWIEGVKLPGGGSMGELFMFGLVAVAITFLAVVLISLWRAYRPAPYAPGTGAGNRRFGGGRLAPLPAGVQPQTDDPWSEALASRARGDLARAIVCLFAHQLLVLNRLRVLRLAPGRTARQLVRSVDDPRIRSWVEPTERLFEAVYYGQHAPSREAFDDAWRLAESLEKHAAEGARG